MSVLSCCVFWLRNLRECRWMPTCNVNFMNRWDWNVQDTFLCAVFRNRKLYLLLSTASLRKTTLQGFVHDEAVAFQGGVSGNAGLFSNAREVAQVYQMLLNGGELNGQRYLSKETCQLFTTEVSKISRRGLGFDKPDTRNPEKSPLRKAYTGKSIRSYRIYRNVCLGRPRQWLGLCISEQPDLSGRNQPEAKPSGNSRTDTGCDL